MWNYIDVYLHNSQFVRKIPTTEEFLNLCKRNTQTFQSQSIPIIRLSQGITKSNDKPIEKVKKIHDWTASHIYYDKDVIRSGIYLQMDISALESLLNKRCVCSGYSNLAVALLRSIGIPAIGVTCQTKSKGIDGDCVNHEICMAYVESHWILMDVTWDSTNIYENGAFSRPFDSFVSKEYFNCTTETISKTHKLIGCVLE